jgi:uncharacterized protein YkwD
MRWLFASLLLVALAGGIGADEKKEAPKFKPSEAEQTLLDLLNKERMKEKLPPLKVNPLLFKIAAAHAANMAKQKKMEHKLDGKTPGQRALAAGYDYRFIGENLGWSDGPAPLTDVHTSWMKSKIHRDNILGKNFQEVGLGIAKDDKGEYYYVQVFGMLKKKR